MDARIVRTRRRLQEALFALARERGIDEVSIADIAERAGVNRSTFYQHYSDKETLLADALDIVATEAGANLECIDHWSEEPPQVLLDFLAHVDAHADLYARVFLEPGYGVVLARLREHVFAAVRTVVEASPAPRVAVPSDIIAAGVAGSVVGILGAWLAREPRERPEEVATWVMAVVLGPPVPLEPATA
ncbi:TetR/AcrR family transcriptional regulator [Demequina sp. NBRC 110056]|uniref:TetR/AcrR family transcriptional regulator n=1 Tax=Demequina sp. NBRC 110056 TaxID=1570345 RepID=UPI0009FC71D0|nr:TetR/AcrR family transcriptional regulator [Demequina sp. NBRC 110056]